MSRFNIAIVEDEPYAARFVERVVRDTGLFDVLGCFESAEELLESPVLKQVQALVSDIRLGGIDGLDMLRRIAAVNPSLHTVIVSGYDSFEYAREAVQLRVIRYLLKPISVDELKSALQALYDATADSLASHDKEYLREAARLGERFAEGEDILRSPYAQVLMLFGFKSREETLLACRRRFAGEGALILPHRHTVVVAKGLESPSDREGTAAWEGPAMTALSGTKTALVYRAVAPLPGDDFYRAVDRMYMNGINRLVPGVRRAASYDPDSPYPVPGDEVKRMSDRLGESLMQRYTSDCVNSLRDAFAQWEKEKAPIFAMRHCLLPYMDRLIALSGAYADAERAEVKACMHALYTADSYAEAAGQIERFLTPLIDKSLEERNRSQKQSHRLFEQITDFLQDHIDKNYSLQEIGDLYGISQPYVSKLFRTYYGGSYKDYVTTLKIDTAKKLIAGDPQIMIKDVAERVGYEQLYFSTVFHRITGQYPRDYRNQAQGKDGSE